MSTQAVMWTLRRCCCSIEEDPFNPLTPYARSKAGHGDALLGYERRGLMHCRLYEAPWRIRSPGSGYFANISS